MKKNINNIFVRFGKLHITKQKGFGGDSFHSPPASRGFYAFPYRFQEMFLVSSLGKTQPNQLNLPKQLEYDEIQKEDASDLREELYTKREKFIKNKILQLRHEFFVSDDKYVWHHLECPHNEIINTNNTWIKTSVFAYKEAIKKETVKLRAQSLHYIEKNDINSIPKRTGFSSKDHFEVFFDTKVV